MPCGKTLQVNGRLTGFLLKRGLIGHKGKVKAKCDGGIDSSVTYWAGIRLATFVPMTGAASCLRVAAVGIEFFLTHKATGFL